MQDVTLANVCDTGKTSGLRPAAILLPKAAPQKAKCNRWDMWYQNTITVLTFRGLIWEPHMNGQHKQRTNHK